MEKKKSINLNPGPLQSPPFFMFLLLSAHVHLCVAMTASAKCCSNIVCTLASECTWGLHGNQDDITWLWRTIRANQWDNVERRKKKNNIQIKSQIKLFVTFIPALPKKVVLGFFYSCLACFLCLPWSYCLCKPVMTVVCVQGVLWGENINAFVFFYYID